MMRLRAAALFALAVLCGCAGGGGRSANAPVPMTPPSASPDLSVQTVASAVSAPSVAQTASTANPARATSVTATFSATPVAGHLILAALSYYYNGAPSPITMPAGWAKLSESASGNAGLGVYYRYAVSGESRSWTWVSRNTDYLALGLTEFSNVAPGSVPAIATSSTNSVAPKTPSLTPAVANVLPIGLFGINIGRVGSQTFTAGSGFTTILTAIPLYHALGMEQGVPTSSAVHATASLHYSSTVASALVLLAPPSTSTPPPATSFVDWVTYGFDNARDGFNPSSTALTPTALASLHLSWQQNQNDNATQSQPILATNIGAHAGLLFVGGQQGIVYAYDALTGTKVWQTPTLGVSQYSCSGGAQSSTGIGGTLAYDPASRTLYVSTNQNAAPNASATSAIVRLDAASGAQLGSVPIATSALSGEFNIAHSGMTLANGFAYAGTGTSCDISSWRGRVAAVNATMTGTATTFFTTYGVGGNYSGGGVWSWGGMAVDASGAVYTGVGNTDTAQGTSGPQPPFQQTTNEQAGYGEHVVRLASNLSAALDSNYPGGNNTGADDVDFAGTPVLFTPLGCSDPILAEQGKAGEVVIYDSLNLSGGPIARFRISPTTNAPGDVGNPAWSPSTGLLYVNVTSGSGGSIDPPGLIALRPSGCNGSTSFAVAWHTAFGPDSFTGPAIVPRSAPTVTAGGVVFAGTPCTANGAGGCNATLGATFGGALWALDAGTGALLNGGNPVLLTGGQIRAPATVDGSWVYVEDEVAELYALTITPGGATIRGRHTPLPQRPTWYPATSR